MGRAAIARRVAGVLVAAACVSGAAQAAPSAECKRLVAYRDTQLLADLDAASRKLVMAHAALSLVKKTQAEAQALADRQPTVNAAFQLVLGLRTVAAAVGGILKINPQTGALMDSAGKASVWVARVLRAESAAGMASAANAQSLAHHVFWEAVGDAGPIGASLHAVQAFADHIQEHKAEYDDGVEMLDAAQKQLKSLATVLAKAQERVKNQTAVTAAINEFKNQIDAQCR